VTNQLLNMRKALLFGLMTFSAIATMAQQTTITWNYDGVSRKYIQYVPSIYDGNEAVPLVVALHGLGDNIANFQGVDFQSVADTANFIVVYPEALVDQLFTGATAWNSGAGLAGISLNSTVDDIGFINALIDTVSAHYNIEQNRVYATGFSMGGFMSNRLACELNNRIAAIASVAGTIGGTLTCTPGESIPTCHFHGTSDTQVGYGIAGGGVQDNTFGNNVLDWIAFWNQNNNCGNITLEGQFPNTNNDNYIVDYVEYAGCSDDTRVVHYKVHGADHTWLFKPNHDIDYTLEIWKFFLGLSPDNLVPSGISDNEIREIGVYPNPTTGVLRIENTESKINSIAVFDVAGQLVKEFNGQLNTIDVSEFETGFYTIMVATQDGIYSNSFVKE
jgi:polyhydroxybutyrate depolymerase